MMDLGAILAELKAVDDFKHTDKHLATASFCQRACKVSYISFFSWIPLTWYESKRFAILGEPVRTHAFRFSCTRCQ